MLSKIIKILLKIVKISLIVLGAVLAVPVLAFAVDLIYEIAMGKGKAESIPLVLFCLLVLGLLLGMLKPSLVIWRGGKKMRTRKMVLIIFISVALGIPVLAFVVYLIYGIVIGIMESIPLFLFSLSVLGLLIGMIKPFLVMWWGGKKMRTRKMVLIVFGSMAAIFLILFGIIYVLPIYNFQEKISEIEDKYKINLEYKNPPRPSYPKTSFTLLSKKDEGEIARYIKIFYEEINKYPQDFIKNVDLREVAFVKNLIIEVTLNGKQVEQHRGGYPESNPGKEALFLDIYLTNYNKRGQRQMIHHELYHMVEEEINGSGYYKDPVWASFNDPKFKYGSGGASVFDSEEDQFGIPKSGGFISVYSTSGLEEDKAEIFSNLMMPKLSKKLYSLVAHDPILAKKVKYMKDFLAKHSKYMDESFWQNILNGNTWLKYF